MLETLRGLMMKVVRVNTRRSASLFETHYQFESYIYTKETKLPLLTRGWVFQERLLSPRVLHFGIQELVWECTELSFCECEEVPHVTSLKKEHFEEIPSIWWWQQLISYYSILNLTFLSDWLPALSGIAKEF